VRGYGRDLHPPIGTASLISRLAFSAYVGLLDQQCRLKTAGLGWGTFEKAVKLRGPGHSVSDWGLLSSGV